MTVIKNILKVAFLILAWVMILLSGFAIAFAIFHWSLYSQVSSDLMVFYLQQNLGGTDIASYTSLIIGYVCVSLLIALVLGYPLMRSPLVRKLRSKLALNKTEKPSLGKRFVALFSRTPSLPVVTLYSLIAVLISLGLVGAETGLGAYLKSAYTTSKLYETYYVDPRKVDLKFPKHKRNLLLIYLESMENTVASKKAGGVVDKSRIPELEKIALDPHNINFTNHPGKLGGAQQTYGLGWSLAGVTAANGGIPLVTPELKTFTRQRGHTITSFLPGAYMLGNILRDHGYNERFLLAADVRFGGLDTMLKEHGNPDVYDNIRLRKEGKLPPDYHVFWGFEDRKLFGFAKEQINQLSSADKPFFLSVFTADTHIPDGYLDKGCPKPFALKYDNVHFCNSMMVAEFLKWFAKQPVAKDTTVVLTGDHLGMKTAYYMDLIGDKDYTRTVYNVFINSAIPAPKPAKAREFTTMDYFPTMLAAMGVQIPGNRLGLGTNLFSNRQTLLEHYGSVAAFNEQLEDWSDYYQNRILKPVDSKQNAH